MSDDQGIEWENLPTENHPDYEKMKAIDDRNKELRRVKLNSSYKSNDPSLSSQVEYEKMFSTYKKDIEYYKEILEKKYNPTEEGPEGIGSVGVMTRDKIALEEEQKRIEAE